MAPSRLLLLLLGCTAGAKVPLSPGDSAAPTTPTDGPCAEGVAWTERRGPVATIQDAVNGAESGETIYLCPGVIEGTTYFPIDPFDSEDTYTELHLVGAGMGETILSPVLDEEADHPVIAIGDIPNITITDCTIQAGRGSTFVIDEYAGHRLTVGGGMWVCGTELTLERVELTDNVAHLGGGLAAWCGDQERSTEITLIDSFVTANSGRHGDQEEGGGGAWLTDSFRLTSVNTDWGTGDTDNLDDDIAIGAIGERKTTYRDFGPAENFVCTSETQTCERTE